ncbi:MAG TPA: pyridoxal-phosphate dependent enzyme [Nitrospinaceae bacterium]|nr:pyridoxal-phosphate dependent enzyme [Nitrospinaceae bacterium]
MANALNISGTKGIIFLPENAAPSKVEALKHYNAELKFHGLDCLTTELFAKQYAIENGLTWVSPYNDPQIIGGQGTIGIEILEELNDVDYVFGCIGGGGMMSGISTYFKERSPKTKLIGCLPEKSAEMYLSVQKGEVVVIEEPEETLSDGSAGGLEPNSITFDICKDLVDDYETSYLWVGCSNAFSSCPEEHRWYFTGRVDYLEIIKEEETIFKSNMKKLTEFKIYDESENGNHFLKWSTEWMDD